MRVLLHACCLAEPLLTGSLAAAQAPLLAAQTGFAGLEWLDRLLPSFRPEEWRDLGQAQRAAGLGPAALSVGLEIKAGPQKVAEQVDRIKVLLGQAQVLGVEAVRIAIGGGRASVGRMIMWLESLRPRKARELTPLGGPARRLYAQSVRRRAAVNAAHQSPPPRADWEELQRAAWALQPLARMAQDHGLKLGLENHFGLTSHPEDMLAILEAAAPAPLGVCLDLRNFFPGQDALAALRLLAPHAVHAHFHLRLARADQEAQEADLAGRLLALRQAGYQGAMGVEYHGPGDGLAGAVAGAELLGRLWGEGEGAPRLRQTAS